MLLKGILEHHLQVRVEVGLQVLFVTRWGARSIEFNVAKGEVGSLCGVLGGEVEGLGRQLT